MGEEVLGLILQDSGVGKDSFFLLPAVVQGHWQKPRCCCYQQTNWQMCMSHMMDMCRRLRRPNRQCLLNRQEAQQDAYVCVCVCVITANRSRRTSQAQLCHTTRTGLSFLLGGWGGKGDNDVSLSQRELISNAQWVLHSAILPTLVATDIDLPG